MRSIFLFLAILVVFTTDSQAQNERIRKLRKAHEYYEAKQYLEAATEYEGLFQSSASSAIMGVDAKANLAHCYVALGKPELAEPLYREVMPDMVSRPEAYLYYAEALMLNGKIDEAKQQALLYSDKRPDDPRGPALKGRCDVIESIRPIFESAQVTAQVNVNRKITDEFASSYCGNNIVFASDRITKGSIAEWTDQQRSYLDLYIAPMDAEGQLGVAKKFPYPVNSPSRHDGPASFTRDGKTMYYSQSAKSSTSAEQLSLQIVVSHYENNRWTAPEVLPFNEPNNLFSHPCISPDGQDLYFMSNRPGGLGGTDIWMSSFRDGRWSAPRNLGPQINTDKNEGYPYMHPSGALFFASKGHANYGGYDIFRARPLGNGVDWNAAENLGIPFNSPKDDTYFLLSDEGFTGYISSRREGDDNVYHFTLNRTDSLPLPADLQARTAPDFLDLEEVKEEVVKTDANGNTTDNNEFSMSDWKVPNTKPLEDESFVDKMLTGGSNGNPGNNTSDDPKKNGNGNTNDGGNNEPFTNNGNGNSTVADNNNDGGNTNSNTNLYTELFGGGNTTNTDPNRKPESNPTLTVNLYVVDGNIGASLTNAKVTVTNQFTKETKEYSVKSDGTVQLLLKPDQKYLVRGECSDYYGSDLPIATIGAYYSETKKAYLPLVKKN